MKYVVEIEETLMRHVIVEAEDAHMAEHIAWQAYNDEEVVLDYRDYADTSFNCVREADDEDIEDYEEVGVDE